MDTELHDKIDELDLEALGDVARLVLSRIYRKLREDEDFGYNMHCIVPSIGCDTYDVDVVIVDGEGLCNGVDYSYVWRSR